MPAASGIYHGPWASYAGAREGRHPVYGQAQRAALWRAGQRVMVIAAFTHCQSGWDQPPAVKTLPRPLV
jgi:hypothetical protein